MKYLKAFKTFSERTKVSWDAVHHCCHVLYAGFPLFGSILQGNLYELSVQRSSLVVLGKNLSHKTSYYLKPCGINYQNVLETFLGVSGSHWQHPRLLCPLLLLPNGPRPKHFFLWTQWKLSCSPSWLSWLDSSLGLHFHVSLWRISGSSWNHEEGLHDASFCFGISSLFSQLWVLLLLMEKSF